MSNQLTVPLTDTQRGLIEEYLSTYGWDRVKACIRKTLMRSLTSQEMDDYIGIAHEALIKAAKRFSENKGMKFSTFVFMTLQASLKTYLTYKNRDKRCAKDITGNPLVPISIDAPIPGDGNQTVGDTIKSKYGVDTELEEMECSDKINKFLNSLSNLPRKIAEMIMDGCPAAKIKEKLNLTDKQYKESWKTITAYENVRILYKDNYGIEGEDMKAISNNDLAETYKNTSYSIDSISKQLRKKRIRDDHILQRHSGQWDRFAQSELVCDVLRGKSLTQIIVSEEIKNGLRMQWLIDGKQRCTTLDCYLHDGFKISPKIRHYTITYQTPKLDENGAEVLNSDGFTEFENREFDIRGKKFSQLPEELQEVFNDRQIPVLYNMNCTKQDIAEDIARFNRSKPMNKAQNGWLELEEGFADLANSITKVAFFQPDCEGSSYKLNDHTKGTIRRIIIESIMLSDYIKNINKEFNKNCEFLTQNATDSTFTDFYCLVERISDICDERVAHLFNGTNSHIWFGLFSRFIKLNIDDEKFVDFLVEFDENMRDRKIDGISYDDLSLNPKTGKAKSTKDPKNLRDRMELLTYLMRDYFGFENAPLNIILENQEIADSDDEQEMTENIIDNDIRLDSVIKKLLVFKDEREEHLFDVKATMIVSGYKYGDFEIETLNNFVEKYNSEDKDSQMAMIEDANLESECLYDYTAGTDINDFYTPDNVLCLLDVYNRTYEDIPEGVFIGWLSKFVSEYDDSCVFAKITENQSSYIMGRISYLYSSLEKYYIDQKGEEQHD